MDPKSDQLFITFHHPLRTIRKDCVRHHAIKLTVLQDRSHIVRDQFDKLAARKPVKYKFPKASVKGYRFPYSFKSTADYVRQFEKMNNLVATPTPEQWEHGFASLDPALPEMWEEIVDE